jgi:hypothetical protein
MVLPPNRRVVDFRERERADLVRRIAPEVAEAPIDAPKEGGLV